LKANVQRRAGASQPDRDRPCADIEQPKHALLAAGLPVLSVDTQKTELIGNFKNAGRSWCQAADDVNDHDVAHDAVGKARPSGMYDLQQHCGAIYVGTAADPPQFAVEMIARWWQTAGQAVFPPATQLLILAAAGGRHGGRPRMWKPQLHDPVADRLGREATVCHYPRGASTWTPSEHRLVGPISRNWAGKPVRTFATMLAYSRGPTTVTGLRVNAVLVDQVSEQGRPVSATAMQNLNIQVAEGCPKWNYPIRPRTTCP
jgi:hypothetical protein